MTAARARRERRQTVLDRAAARLCMVVPDLDPTAATRFVERATVAHTLRRLETHLAEHPHALISGSSDAPLAVQRLAGLLADAGHTTVVVPGCLRCGRLVLLPHIVDGGRVCDNCRRFYHRAPCGRCGHDRPIATHTDRGDPLCRSCIPCRREPCGTCGRVLRVQTRRADGAAVCPNCYRAPQRRCCRCEHTASTYAHTADGPICKSCYRRPLRRCGACGEHRRIDRRATATSPDICIRCRTRRLRSCTVCGTAYPAHPRAQHPVCLPCRDAGHILEPELTESPGRVRRRRDETGHDALITTLHAVIADPQRGIAAQLTVLDEVFRTVPNPEITRYWLRRRRGGAALLHQIALRAHDEPITHQLLDSVPHSAALPRLRDLFVHAGILPDRTDLIERIGPWLDEILERHPAHHGELVRPFAHWHVLRRARRRARNRPVTDSAAAYARSQISLALDFLSWLDEHDTPLATATQADLDRWLDGGSRYRYFLANFITWATTHHRCTDLVVPNPHSGEPSHILTDDDRWAMLARCLHDETLPLHVRASGALVLLYGRTITSIAGLTTSDIIDTDTDAYLRIGNGTVPLPPALATLVHSLADDADGRAPFPRPGDTTRFLFQGRRIGKPTTPKVLARNLRTCGIDPRPARHAARAAWAREIPAPIAADVLGIHITTATRWAGRTRRDWTHYLAIRTDTAGHTHDNPGKT
ncbi:hypothetical protein [Rhodococcus pyridinivorans]|uniref:Site-specific recombinase XerD n=1 Tax=Rhodococcus pyridinivorans TaxID=103816 RepID=A0A7M2XVU4_9NOCA|nr:hypothetical protein [Rhodococcus pyridinivorans]QOW01444.1 hypothetical protein INP59_24885 [Rhodococcus pyridinivorans]